MKKVSKVLEICFELVGMWSVLFIFDLIMCFGMYLCDEQGIYRDKNESREELSCCFVVLL